MEEDGTEKNFPATYRTKGRPPTCFLVLIIHLLRDGGRGAMVLPDGNLFGECVKTRIKQELLEKCNLHTIVRLPTASSLLTPASKPTSFSFPKASQPKTFGITNTPIRRA